MDVKRKTRTGRVISDKMDKTVIVAVDSPRRHPIYKKTIRRIVKYYAHDEKNKAKTGDMVLIEETRPLSRLKRWRVAEILITGEVAEIKPQEITSES
jgi:small subunit ribosomal protein S17